MKRILLLLFFAVSTIVTAQRRTGIQDYATVSALQAETLTPQQNDKVLVKATNYLYTWNNSSVATHDGDKVIKQTNITTGRFLLVGIAQSDLNLKANLASPAFTGNPTAPTQTAGNNTTRLATTAFVQTAISGKENTITAGTTAQYYRGDKTFQTLDKTAVGLPNVDNTSDANKPVSTAQQTALNGKENTITAGTTAQYYRGDKTFQTLDKTAVGLPNVDNTSDANKPVSTAQQTALNLKANIASPTFTGTPTAPTATAGTNTTQLATTAFVTGAATTLQTAIDTKTGFFTIAQIRAFGSGSVTSNPRVYMTDAGKEGVWFYDNSDGSTADNTGTVIVTSSGARYKRDYQGAIYASWFKESSDAIGATRDRAAINRAVTFAIAQTVPPTVIINQGTWIVENNAIYLTHTTGKTLRIKGESGTVIDFLCTGAAENGTSAVFRTSNTWSYPGNSTTAFTGSVSGNVLTVTAVSAGTILPGQSIIDAGGNVIQGTKIVTYGTGTGGTGTYFIDKDQTLASVNFTTDAAFLAYTNGNRAVSVGSIEIDGITFYGGRNPANNGSATVFSRPILLRGCEYVSITHCTFLNIPGSAFAIAATNGGIIQNNRSKSVFARNTNDDIGDFCTLYAYCQNFSVANNIIELSAGESGRCGISADTYTQNSKISGNHIIGYERGIHVELCRNIVVTQNTVYSSPIGGMSSSNSFCSWTDNIFDNNNHVFNATLSDAAVFFAYLDTDCSYKNNTILCYSNRATTPHTAKFWGQRLKVEGNGFHNISNYSNSVFSTTSVTQGTGSKTFSYATNTGLNWVVGNRIRAQNAENVFMLGTISAVSSTSVTISVYDWYNTGTYASWTLSLTDSRVTGYGANRENTFTGNLFENADLYLDLNSKVTVQDNTFKGSLLLAQTTTDAKITGNIFEPYTNNTLTKGIVLTSSAKPYVSGNKITNTLLSPITNTSCTDGIFEDNTYFRSVTTAAAYSAFFSTTIAATDVKKTATARYNIIRDYTGSKESYYVGNSTTPAAL